MSDPRLDLPPANSPNFSQRVREALMTFFGRQGNPLDRGLTVRDLVDADIIDIKAGYTLKSGASSLPLVPGSSIEPAYTVDSTAPPMPSNFTATAAISNIVIEHDPPVYTQGNGHSRTVLYGATWESGPLPTFSNAVEIAQFVGTVYPHPTNPATTWHLWIKWESVDGGQSLPAGGTNGVVVTTGQDVSKLLTALESEITATQLNTALSNRIDLIDAPSSTAGSVNARVLAEQTARESAIAAETTARQASDAQEATTRALQIGDEARNRIATAEANAESILRAALGVEKQRTQSAGLLAFAKTELKTDFDAGISAEATARLDLAARVTTAEAGLVSEQTARATADSALSSQITVLTADVASNTSAIASESTARATADAAEATSRDTLATQLRGTYTGTDLASLTSGLIYQERLTRISEDAALSQQITLLSAGAGEQFDWQTIWYFDAGIESWGGNGSPTATAGWLRPADHATTAYVNSPTGIGAAGNQYSQAKLRIRKTGSPTFDGYLWWKASTDSTWDAARRIALTAPTFDANGIGLITVSPGWTVTVDQIRIDLSAAQTSTDYFEIDWVAIGRPSPGASSAQMLSEQVARATADTSETTARQALSSKLTGATDPASLTLATLSSGLLYDEKTTRISEDAALASSITTLTATVTGNYNTLSSSITAESTARAAADSTEATARQSLSSTLTGAADPTGLTLATLSSGLIYEERIARSSADASMATDITTLNTSLGSLSSTITTTQTALTTLNSTTAASVQSLQSADRQLQRSADEEAQTLLQNVIAGHQARVVNEAALALVHAELNTQIIDGLLAEASSRTLLYAQLNSDLTAAIATESIARADADASISSTITTLTATVADNSAAITSESTARATADTALASSVVFLQAQIDTNTASITTESTARATADSAISAQITTLSTTIDGNTAAIATEQAARINADSAMAEDVSILQAQIDSNSAAITSETSVRATETGDLFAKYVVKVDVNGYVSGFGLASTANNATPYSNFIIRADKFSVASPSGPGITPIIPFVVNTTTETVNGVSVPVGVYMDAAYIKNGTILSAKIGNLQVDDAKIASLSVSKLTAGEIAVGQYIQSTGFTSGSDGFKINGNGSTEFNNVTARGNIYASGGTIGGINIGSTYLQSVGYVAGTTGFRMNSDGTGHIGGVVIGSNYLASANYVAGTTGWKFSTDGTGQIQASMLVATSLSAITANLGTITAGKAQNAAGTNYIDFNAAGASSFLKVGSKVDIKADGSGVFARSIISPPNVVASGTKSVSITVGDGDYGYATQFTHLIDTGISVSSTYYTASVDKYVATATIGHGSQSPAGGFIGGLTKADVLIGDGFVSSGSPTGWIDNRIYIQVSFVLTQFSSAGKYMTVSDIDWSLAKI